MVGRTIAFVALLLVALTAPWVVWIYLPAPISIELWLIAALVSEFHLILALGALIVLVLAFIAWRLGVRTLPLISGIIGLVILVGALLPVAQAYNTARAEGVRLSLSTYFAGLAISTDRQPRTETYAVVEGEPLQLDVWEPVQPSDALRPAVVMVHGGAWETGTRSATPRWKTWLNDQGIVVVDIDYRLAPPARWQAAPGDVKCAIDWVKQHAATLRVNPNQVVVMGVSSGGHLALLAAYTDGDRNFPPSCPVQDTSVSAVVALSPPTDLKWQYDLELPWWYSDALASVESLEKFTGGTPTTVPEAYRLGSPINHVKAGLPPTLLVRGGRDQLVFPEETDRLATRLAEAKVPHRVVRLSYANHLFDLNWGGWGSQITRPVLADFLNRYVHGDG